MSELTKCNYCTLKYYKSKYGQNNVVLRVVKGGEMKGWLGVFVISRQEYIGYFEAISDSCCC